MHDVSESEGESEESSPAPSTSVSPKKRKLNDGRGKTNSKMDLDGKKIVFTGALTKATRKQAAARAQTFGCIIAPGVSKNVDIVIAGSGAGQKLDRAEDLGIHRWRTQ